MQKKFKKKKSENQVPNIKKTTNLKHTILRHSKEIKNLKISSDKQSKWHEAKPDRHQAPRSEAQFQALNLKTNIQETKILRSKKVRQSKCHGAKTDKHKAPNRNLILST